MKSFSCMPAVQTPEAPRDTRHLRIPGSRLPLGVIGSATPTDFDFGANTPFTFVPACKPPCLRFAVTVTGHHARLGTRLLARLCRGGHPRPPNFMRFPRRNAHRTGRALLTHPALGQDITPSHTEGHEQPSDQPPGPCYPSVLRSARLLATANATPWGDRGSLNQRPGSSFASACGAFRSSHTSSEFDRVAPISRALPLPAPASNQGPFPPPALPGLLSNTGLSATP